MNPLISWIVLLGSSVAPKKCDVQSETFLYSLERESVMRLLLSRAHLLQERLERNEAVIVSGVAHLLGQLLTEVHQQLEQLELQDGVVGIFVVQLQDLNEVVEATLVLGVLA